MPDEVERHFRMVDEQESVRRMEDAIHVLQQAHVDFVVEGGWAVAAYGSTIPSVDLDVLIPGGLTEAIAQAIEDATGYQIYSQSTRDTLALDFVDADHANPLIDRPGLSYVPTELLAGQTERRPIVDGVEVTVPVPATLVFMKFKAFHDRLLQWRAARGERYLLAGMEDFERQRTMTSGQDHWLRKAGKDLFDVSFLLRDLTTLDEVAQVAPSQIWAEVQQKVHDVPLPVRRFAQDMAERADVGKVPILGSGSDQRG